MKEQIEQYNEIRKTEGSKAANDFAAKFIYGLQLEAPAERGKVWAQFKAEEKAEAKAAESGAKAAKKAAEPPKAKLKATCEAILKSLGLSDYERKFLNDIKTKRKLTVKQASWLRDLAKKTNVEIVGEIQIRESHSANASHNCNHEDLGSLGYTHGTTVRCPHCGKLAEVW